MYVALWPLPILKEEDVIDKPLKFPGRPVPLWHFLQQVSILVTSGKGWWYPVHVEMEAAESEYWSVNSGDLATDVTEASLPYVK